MDNISRRTWDEFRETGLFWWINNLLHTFGWAIIIELDDAGYLTDCYPARVKYRGFTTKSNMAGFEKVSRYMKENASILHDETIGE